MVKPDKNKMSEELENKACVTTKDFVYSDSNEEAVLIDLMSFIRKQILDTRVKELKAPSIFGI